MVHRVKLLDVIVKLRILAGHIRRSLRMEFGLSYEDFLNNPMRAER